MEARILLPHRTLFEGTLQGLTLPGKEGSFQIFSHHAPLLAALGEGTLSYKKEEKQLQPTVLHIQGGMVEVKAHGEVVVLIGRLREA